MSETEEKATVKTTVNAGYLADVFQALEGVRDEGKMKFTEDGIFSKVNTPSNTMMAVCRVKGQALNGITIQGGNEVVLGSRYEKIHEILSTFKSSSDIQVEYPHEKHGSRAIKFYAPDEGTEWKVTTLDTSTVEDIPQTDPIAHEKRIVISGSDLKKAISNAEMYVSDDSNGVELGTDGDVFYIESSDKVDGSFYKEFHQSGPSGGDDLGNEVTTIGFPLLDSVSKVVGGCDKVTVHIRDSHPLRLDLDLDENGDAQIIYIMAPRVNT